MRHRSRILPSVRCTTTVTPLCRKNFKAPLLDTTLQRNSGTMFKIHSTTIWLTNTLLKWGSSTSPNWSGFQCKRWKSNSKVFHPLKAQLFKAKSMFYSQLMTVRLPTCLSGWSFINSPFIRFPMHLALYGSFATAKNAWKPNKQLSVLEFQFYITLKKLTCVEQEKHALIWNF